MSTSEAQPHRPSSLPRWKSILFSLIPLLGLVIFGELVLRGHRGELLSLENKRGARLSLLRSGYQAVYDARLGYIPRPGFRGKTEIWNSTVAIDRTGLRTNGQAEPVGSETLLAVGDSFTFGDEVSDDETWPAYLERLLDKRVLNGGVSGYGFDQVVLRLETLLTTHDPDTVIVAVIPDDVLRCELSNRFASKPYFDIEEGQLVLRNVPVPRRHAVQSIKDILGHSHLVDYVLFKTLREWWLASTPTIRVHDKGPEVAKLLVDRLHTLSEEHHFGLLLIILGRVNSDPELVLPMTRRARELGIDVLDLLQDIRDAELDPAIRSRRRTPNKHMSPDGNRWIAERIQEKLRSGGTTVVGSGTTAVATASRD